MQNATRVDGGHTTTTIAKLKQGEYFKRISKRGLSRETYTRGEYDRTYKRFSCAKHSDIWGWDVMLKGSTVVAVGFTY